MSNLVELYDNKFGITMEDIKVGTVLIFVTCKTPNDVKHAADLAGANQGDRVVVTEILQDNCHDSSFCYDKCTCGGNPFNFVKEGLEDSNLGLLSCNFSFTDLKHRPLVKEEVSPDEPGDFIQESD